MFPSDLLFSCRRVQADNLCLHLGDGRDQDGRPVERSSSLVGRDGRGGAYRRRVQVRKEEALEAADNDGSDCESSAISTDCFMKTVTDCWRCRSHFLSPNLTMRPPASAPQLLQRGGCLRKGRAAGARDGSAQRQHAGREGSSYWRSPPPPRGARN